MRPHTRTLFRGGLVVDGTGAPGRRADVAVVGGVISEVGRIPREAGDIDIDVAGLVVAPGFIDPHTHYDAQILWDPTLSPSPLHGVTTVVMGNCGFSIAPARTEHHDVLCRTLENVEGMSADALRAGITWNFETFPQWLNHLRSIPKLVNVASMIGHSAMRLYVLGIDAAERPASLAEIATMRRMVAEALHAGAIGFATSMSPNHQGDGGKPVPSRGATFDEIREIAHQAPACSWSSSPNSLP